jgi:anti-sigma-K factor RskA
MSGTTEQPEAAATLDELAAGYALGALDEAERARFEAELASNPDAVSALARAHIGAAALGAALPPVRPRREVWQAIEARLGEAEAPRRRSRTLGALPWVVAAAAAAAAIFLWRRSAESVHRAERAEHLASFRASEVDSHQRALTAERSGFAECRRDLDSARGELGIKAEAVALLELPDTRVVTLSAKGGGGHSGSAIVNLGQKQVVVVAAGLVAQAGKDYELWVIKGDKKVAAGLLHGGDRGQAIARVDPALLGEGADAFAVTLEPAGGGAAPVGPIVLVGML